MWLNIASHSFQTTKSSLEWARSHHVTQFKFQGPQIISQE